MSLIKHYVDYLKDNPKGYWFKRKLYGWGWTPVTWQGWLVVLAVVFVIIFSVLGLPPKTEPTGGQLLWLFVKIILSITALLIICYKKGESPKWQWGIPNKKD